MNIVDKNKKILSSLVANQLPLTVRKDYDSSINSTSGRSIFSDFIEAYYEFIEREVAVSVNDFKNVSLNRYRNNSILSLGPQSGGPYNITNKLPSLRDFDHTIETLKKHIKSEYLQNIPDDMEGNLNNLFRLIRTINLSKGTEAAYKALFRYIWNANVDLFETNTEIFKPSDNFYKVEKVIRLKLIGGSDTNTSSNMSQFKDNYIVGSDSGAKVLVNSVFNLTDTVYEMSIDEGTLEGSFLSTEEVFAQSQSGSSIIRTGSTQEVRAKIVPGISKITLTNTGIGYLPGDEITIKSDTGSGAKIKVKDVSSGPIDSLIVESSGDGYVLSGSKTSEYLSFSSAYIDVYNGEGSGTIDIGRSATGIEIDSVGYTGYKSASFTGIETSGGGNDDLTVSFETDTFGSIAHGGEIKTYTVTAPTSNHWSSVTNADKTATTHSPNDPTENAQFKVTVVSGTVETYTNNIPGTGSGEVDWTDNTFEELPSTTNGSGSGATFKVVISGTSTNFAVTTVKKGSGYANGDKIYIAEPNNGTGTTLELTLHSSTGIGAVYTVSPSTLMGKGYSVNDTFKLTETGKSDITITVDSIHTAPSIVSGGTGYQTNDLVTPVFTDSSITGAWLKITGTSADGVGDWKDGTIYDYIQNSNYNLKGAKDKIFEDDFYSGSGGRIATHYSPNNPTNTWGAFNSPYSNVQPASGSIRSFSVENSPDGTNSTTAWTSPRTYTNRTAYTSADTFSSGDLTIGKSYKIIDNSGDADWTNIHSGSSNDVGTIFTATGTTPTSWGTGKLIDNTLDTKGAKFTIAVSEDSNVFTATLTEPGKGYSVNEKLYFAEGDNDQGTGTRLEVQISELIPTTARFTVSVTVGGVHTMSITNEGSGYKAGDLLVLSPPGNATAGANDITPIEVTGVYDDLINATTDADDTITINQHNLTTGDGVVYKQLDSGTGYGIGLTNNTTYYASKVDDNKIKLYDTHANAQSSGATGLKDITTSILTGKHRLLRTIAGLNNPHVTANVIVKAYPLSVISDVSNGQFPNVWRIFIDDITGSFSVGDAIRMGTLVGEVINVHEYQVKPQGKYELKTSGTAAQQKQVNNLTLIDGGAGYKVPPQPYIHWVTTTSERNYSTEGHANLKAYGSSAGGILSFDVVDPGIEYLNTDQVIFPNKIQTIFSIVSLYRGTARGTRNSTASGVIKTGAILTKSKQFSDNVGFMDSTQRLPDYNTYQPFSYAIESAVHPDKYKDLAKQLLHPAGLRMVTKYVIESKTNRKPTTKVLWESS
tara:strand:+ start:17871 stop:21674 length:3804 start_codon:yes stop_codon:yes gene_type:complete